MELLLILSALLTGLTGAFTGDRVRLPAAGVEAAASVDVEQLAETAVAALQRPDADAPEAGRAEAGEPQMAVVAVIGASERRLE